MMNYNGFGDTFDKSLTMWKGNNALTEYGFIYNNGNTMGQYMVNVSGSFAHQRVYTDHGGSGDANYAVTADNADYTVRNRFSVSGTSAFTDVIIGRNTVSTFQLRTDEVNPIQVTGSLDVTGDLAIAGIPNVSASIAAGAGAAFPFTGSAGISGSLVVDGAVTASNGFNSTGFNKTSTFNGTITSTQGSIQALGGNGGNAITIGNSGYGLQYPSMNVFTDSASYAASGGVYAAHRLEDRGTGDFATFALSTFNADDPGNLALEVQYRNDIVWWISEAENRFHVNKELKAVSGAQITGSVNITGSTDIDGVLSLPGITNVSASIASAGGGSAFPFVGSAEITGSLNISGSTTGNIATPPLTSSGGTGFEFTASLDFNQASFFNIALDNGSTYHFKTYNAQPGQTVTLRVPQSPDGNGAIEFAPEFKFPGGNTPVATQGIGAEDIYTFVTFDTGSVYTVQTPGLS